MFGDFEAVPDCIMYDNLIKDQVHVDDFTLSDVNGLEDTVAVMCSSGTTGLPKGVELTHVNFLTLSAHMKWVLYTHIVSTSSKSETNITYIVITD